MAEKSKIQWHKLWPAVKVLFNRYQVAAIALCVTAGEFLSITVNSRARAGFPDGYKTAFDRAAEPFQTAGGIVFLALMALSFVLAIILSIYPENRPARTGLKILAVIALLTVLAVFLILPFFFSNVAGLDSGQGG